MVKNRLKAKLKDGSSPVREFEKKTGKKMEQISTNHSSY